MNSNELLRMDLNLLRVFYRVYVSKSVSKAAADLGSTQPGISHSLRRLREVFGDELFVRSGLGLASTPRADQLFPPVQHLMMILENEIAVQADFNPAGMARQFVISMGDLSEVRLLPPLMRLLKEQAPNCALDVRRIPPHRIIQALNDGSIELGVGILPPQGAEHLVQQKLFAADYSILACKNHPRVLAAPSWEAYAAEEHLVSMTSADEYLQKTILEPLGIKRRVRANVEGFLSIPWLIQDTEAIATVPARLSDTLVNAAKLNQFPLPPVEGNEFAMQAVWHPRVHNEPGHKWLRQTLFGLLSPDYMDDRVYVVGGAIDVPSAIQPS